MTLRCQVLSRLPLPLLNSKLLSIKLMSTIRVAQVNDPRPHPENHRSHHPAPGSKAFRNPWPSWGEMASPWKFAQASIKGDIAPKSIPRDIQQSVHWRKTNYVPALNTQTQMKAVWLGHASLYLEFPSSTTSRGLRILCDPVFSQRCSPSQWAGPKRFTPCPTSVAELPEIDAVVISHNHYDHLDHATIMSLKARFPELHFFVPLGVKKWFLDCGMLGDRVTQMDWWDEMQFFKTLDGQECGVRLGYLPSQHFSARGMTDRFHTLWGSWSLESINTVASEGTARIEPVKIYFAGDTGRRTISQSLEQKLDSTEATIKSLAQRELESLPVCPAHAQIGALRGPFDLAFIPIGAYKPRYLMSLVHIDPQEAIEIYRELRAQRGVGIHWGTFTLTAEEVMDPKERLLRLSAEQGIQGFETWAMGEMMYV